jgi:hypothetical protein
LGTAGRAVERVTTVGRWEVDAALGGIGADMFYRDQNSESKVM